MFALPTLGSNILQSLNGSINAIWVGQFLGEVALAAASNANMVMFLMFSGVFGLAMATSILVGQAAGRRDIDEVRQVMGTSFSLFGIIGIALGALGFVLAPHVLHLLDTPADVFPLALAYLRIIFIAMAPMFVTVLITMSLRGTGDAVTPLIFMGLSVAVDVALNPVFILGLGPFPRMGIAGSSTATLVANVISLIALMTYVYAKDLPVRLRGSEWSYLRPQMRFIPTIVGRGIVMSMQMFLMAISGLALLGLVNRAGSTVLAAYGATNQIWTYIQMPSMAVAAAVSAMAAQNIGAGRWDRLGEIAKSGVLITSVVTAVMATAILLLDHRVLALFLQADGAALPIAEHINRVAIWSWLVLGVSMIPGSIVRASGAVMVPLLILIVSIFPVRLGFAYGFEPHYGPDAIWWSMIVGAIASFAMTVCYYRWGGWRNVRLLEKGHVPPAAVATRELVERLRP